MKRKSKNLPVRIGVLRTWVVSVQEFAGAEAAFDRAVVLERNLDGDDINGLAVLTHDGEMLGYVPSYDTVPLSPLLAEGVVSLKATTGRSRRPDIVPLAIEVFATGELSTVIGTDASDDWRAIIHNAFALAWGSIDSYTSTTIKAFRDHVRPFVHDAPLYPKTQFLYRMMKGIAEDRAEEEVAEWRERLTALFAGATMVPTSDDEIVSVVALLPPEDATVASLGTDETGVADTGGSPADRAQLSFGSDGVGPVGRVDLGGESASDPPNQATANAPTRADRTKERLMAHLHPLRLSQKRPPNGAQGFAMFVEGRLVAIEWFESPEGAEVHWFQSILAAVPGDESPPGPVPDDDGDAVQPWYRRAILSAIEGATIQDAVEMRGGAVRFEIVIASGAGYAVWGDGRFERVHWSTADMRSHARSVIGRYRSGHHDTSIAHDAHLAEPDAVRRED